MKYTSPQNKQSYYTLVWQIVRQIPPGKVSTYGQVARLIHPPSGVDFKSYQAFGPRWVGGAMSTCPKDVPWQRVINSQGKISLGRGAGASQQKQLLEAEGVDFDERDRVDLDRYGWDPPED